MSRIDDLIVDLCPDGVEFRALGDVVANFDSKRRPVTRSDRRSGEFPYYGANGVQDSVDDFLFDGVFLLIGEDGSVISGGGAPVLNWATGKIWVNNHAHVLQSKTQSVDSRFLYFYLQTVDITQFVTGGTQPKLNQRNMNAIPVAVPPLEVQREIVRILDQFTALEAELEAELEARRRQYHHYRDSLLTFTERERVRWTTLSDICRVSRGRVMSKDYLGAHPGPFPVYSSQTASDGQFGSIDSYDFEGEFLTWTTDGANAGSVFYRNGRFSITNVCGLVEVADGSVSTRFLYYALGGLTRQYVNEGMGNPKLMSNVMSTIRVPVPPLLEQERIVEILDSFDALVNDLSIGLPAELAARRKQYEHYRDRLLTFKERSV